jgi:peptide deformylase
MQNEGILPIYLYGSGVLYKRTKDLTEEESSTPEIKKLISDMITTMVNGEGIGLAANQVGVLKSIIVLNQASLEEVEIYNLPSVLINPHIVEESEEVVYTSEACLSFPHLTAQVERAKKIVVEYRDEMFQPQTITADGIGAVVLQHEIDHLRGMTMTLHVRGIERKRLDVVIKRITRAKADMDVGYPSLIKK